MLTTHNDFTSKPLNLLAYCRYLGLLYSAFLASQNIDGYHLKAPVLAILLETVEGKRFCQIASLVPKPSIFCPVKKLCYMHRIAML